MGGLPYGRIGLAFLYCSGRNYFGELFSKFGKLHLRNSCPWHQFLLKLKHTQIWFGTSLE